MVTILQVEAGSLAARAGIEEGDILLDIDGHAIDDVLDYRFYLASRQITIRVHRGVQILSFSIKKPEYADIGLDFESFLMDDQRRCKNKCVFCFIDQLPPGMRQSLYFKDDDSRMSFLAGSYVTLTNMSEEDIDRIIKMHISPIHISIHTVNPDLRVKMMKNPRAADVMPIMRRFAQAGIEMHGQIVLCKGWNDGEELERSMNELGALYPAMKSVSVVPIGLTKFREKLEQMQPFTKADATEVLGRINKFAADFLQKHDTRLIFASDEWYLKAECPLPTEEEYEDYPQLDNGVGMLRSLLTEAEFALDGVEEKPCPRPFSIATGVAAAPLLLSIVSRLKTIFPAMEGAVYPIENDFFGHEITVAGLVTGSDLIAQLKGKPLGERLFLPYVMLRYEKDRFLDDITPAEVEKALGVTLCFVENDGFDLIEKILQSSFDCMETEKEV